MPIQKSFFNPSNSFEARSLQTISIPSKETLYVKTGAMQAFSSSMTMKTNVQLSINALMRKYFGGGDLLINSFTATAKPGWISLEEETPGQIVQHTLQPGEILIMRKDALVAFDSNVDFSLGLSGVHGYLSNIGFLVLQAKTKDNNPGRIFFSSEQGIIKKLDTTHSDDPATVDNKHIIAYTATLKPGTTAPGSFFSWGYGKEGIATQFSGQGTIYIGCSKEALASPATQAAERAIQSRRVQAIAQESLASE
ncbi:MAG: AIM24 family protein [Rhabdochlamydiaceae bacterium]|nr:AIM24 family protein [Rhabdochlamydiaceae bacterium]